MKDWGGWWNDFTGVTAANDQKSEIQKALDLQQQMYNQSRQDQMPWMQAGQQSLSQLMDMTSPGYDYSQLTNDPGYQFQLQQGQQALERSAAAKGGLNSGGFMKGLDQYSQGLASRQFGNRFNRLASIAGMGQGSTAGLGALGQGYANSESSLYGAMGNAMAAGDNGVPNFLGKWLGTATGIATSAMGGGFGGGGGGGLSSLGQGGYYAPSSGYGMSGGVAYNQPGMMIPIQGY